MQRDGGVPVRDTATQLGRRMQRRVLRKVASTAAGQAMGLSKMLGFLDAPTPDDVFGFDLPLIGWAGATNGEPVRVRAVIEGIELCDLATSEARVDVSVRHPGIASMCGFNTRVRRPPLPDRDTYCMEVEAYTPTRREIVASVTVRWLPQDRVPHHRHDYRRTWESVVDSNVTARYAVAGFHGDEEWQRNGRISADTLIARLDIGPNDVVLEVGCGAGRVGTHLLSHCAKWIGADVSSAMLEAARAELGDRPNLELVQLDGSDLGPIADASVDRAYCTVVFMHLEEWDRFRYVQEMHRVLRPGGRIYVDNFDLMSDEGWDLFESTSRIPPEIRPLNVSKSSTALELRRYLQKAGFEDIELRPEGLFITASGRKPGA